MQGAIVWGTIVLGGNFWVDCSGTVVQGGIPLFPSIHWEASAVSEDET